MIALVVAATVVSSGPTSLPALGGFAMASAAFLLWRNALNWVAVILFALAAASVVALYWLVSTTPLALFFLAAAATWREPRRPIALTLALATVSHAAVQLVLGQDTILTGLATVVGVAFLFALARLVLSERQQRERIAQLLAEVEQRRQSERASFLMAERGRMARELHDVLAHTLSGLAIQLEGARILGAQDGVPRPLREAVENAHRLSRAGLQEARRAVAALRGDQLPGPDLIPDLVEEHRLSAGSLLRYTVTGSARSLDAEASLALYRTAQEALSNVRKHAAGAAVDIGLEWTPSSVILTVQDTGGAGLGPTAGSGFGLTGMAERADLIGATLETGMLGRGYRVRLTIPSEEHATTPSQSR
jgi:signal transduction histidine kinase